MKVMNNILKVVTALAAVAGVVFIVAEYGDKIVAWAKDMKEKIACCNRCNIIEFTPAEAEETEEPAEEEVTEEAPAAEEAEEAPAEETAPVAEGEPAAEEEDFEA